MEQQDTQLHPETEKATTCYLKWFNTAKGFGFVVPEGSTDDVFLHASILQRGGHPIIGKGALLSCVVDKSDNGYFVKDVVNVIQPGECPFAKKKSSNPFSSLNQRVYEISCITKLEIWHKLKIWCKMLLENCG